MKTPDRKKDGQDATATVELAILLPVYMLLFVGVLSIGHLVLIRQKVVEAVRFQAWLPNENRDITSNFFATFQGFSGGGTYTQTNKSVQPWRIDENGIYSGAFNNVAGGGNASAQQKQLAIAVLNDNPSDGGTNQHLYISHVEGLYTYRPEWLSVFIKLPATRPATGCTVLVRRTMQDGGQPPERKVLRFGKQNLKPWEVSTHNPIEKYLGPYGFDISAGNENPSNRFFTPGAPDTQRVDEQGIAYDGAMAGGIPANQNGPRGDPGIWDQGYRLGGGVEQERAIHRKMLFGY